MATRDCHPLNKSNAHFASPKGPSLSDRLESYSTWIEDRISTGYWPYARSLVTPPEPTARIAYTGRTAHNGINLAVQDYLALSTHPEIKEAAISATRDFGVHSAGSAMLLGNNPLSLQLEAALSDLLHLDHILLFPTGWAAGYGTVSGLIRNYDHIVMDQLAHACLQQGAAAATQNVHRFRHLDVAHAAEILGRIRSTDTQNAILVIAEGVFSMDSDSPDLASLQASCREFRATLLVDVAHDLGCLGDGTGQIGMQGMLGKVDIVMGAFSKTFASNGGFIATSDPRIKRYLQWFANPHTFSNALSPVQCAVVNKAISVVRSHEGESRRRSLLHASTFFRARLGHHGLETLGSPSAIVPVMLGKDAFAREASKAVAESGTFVNLVEFPAVGLGAARFRCQLMATHTDEQLAQAAQAICDAILSTESGPNRQFERTGGEILAFD
ncbi:aminotransferase class I/II-fold pyridoxal phosphate-dependent enzyme [Rhizobium pisi]|uniref:aminotransferase class I/II-fold pyridoxal phosphate-dependent enzyme n=1 Tax=Rhizobium pisi TaxID=574561 RepID=UPI0039B04DEA